MSASLMTGQVPAIRFAMVANREIRIGKNMKTLNLGKWLSGALSVGAVLTGLSASAAMLPAQIGD